MPPGRQQAVLAALLLDLNRVVSTDHLVDMLWAHDPPETARTQVQICISRLRRLLRPVRAVIETRPPGYLLRAEPEKVDLHLFRARTREAVSLRKKGRLEEAAALLREADALWRGPALSGIEAGALRTRATRIGADRVDALEQRVGIELELGRHARLVAEIPALLEENPLREGLCAHLMLALYRSGRKAEALQVYRSSRDRLVEELGLEPGAELRALEVAILNQDPDLHPDSRDDPGPLPAPGSLPSPDQHILFQLPSDTSDFVGRGDTEAAVADVLVRAGESAGIAVLLGPPGVGKSAAAVHVAHRLAEEYFPDGQLYCDLRGTSEAALTPSQVLGRFLRALGVPGQAIPDDLDERAVMYRGLLAARRVLIVLDDAASERQVSPLIPGGDGCRVLITSRARLTGVPGARRFELGPLDEKHALALLHRVVGARRVENEPESARTLVGMVGRLPLALRIVAARLAAKPHWTLSMIVARLSDERHRLDELEHGDMTVRASLSLTYDGLDGATARLFGQLGLVEAPTIPVWGAGALLDDRRAFPADLVEPLVDTHMLDTIGVDGAGEPIYRFHHLVREYAREKGGQDPSAARERVRRWVGGWLYLLEEANRRVFGTNLLRVRGRGARWSPPQAYVERLLADPHQWIERERTSILTAIRQAADSGLDEECWELVSQFCVYAERRGFFDDFEEALRSAVAMVRTAANVRGIAAMDFSTCSLRLNRGENDAADEALARSLTGFAEVEDRFGVGLCRAWMAESAYMRQEMDEAWSLCETALADFEAVGEPEAMWRPLTLLGRIRADQRRFDDGQVYLERALRRAEATGDPRARSQVLYQRARADLSCGRYLSARNRFHEALALITRPGDPMGEALIRFGLGRVHLALGEVGPAREFLGRSLELWERLDDHEGVVQVRGVLDRLSSCDGSMVTTTR
ncbi:AfsR/SARP family transcriptional regulator [Nocardiopsis aegyptia]|uniref:DNA-binding SARP family transcriptional activator n=1 Tax=Nocardiopsis aegyptia TaxID=220378 RepID=A0A7Z0EPK4_9ACTN|nr:BTAD domain-containing putative transcriptional regulator [Nocardiopsis aegyptia]NYJ35607.1 DNA-binding SARP family transcriptional activator [Nocardiopsis aegyptia]